MKEDLNLFSKKTILTPTVNVPFQSVMEILLILLSTSCLHTHKKWKIEWPKPVLYLGCEKSAPQPACPLYVGWIQKTPPLPTVSAQLNEAISAGFAVMQVYMLKIQKQTSSNVVVYCISLLYRKKHTLNSVFNPKLLWLMHSFHPSAAGRNRAGDECLSLIWIFQLFITRESVEIQAMPRVHEGDGWGWMKPCFGFDRVPLLPEGAESSGKTWSCWFWWTYLNKPCCRKWNFSPDSHRSIKPSMLIITAFISTVLPPLYQGDYKTF